MSGHKVFFIVREGFIMISFMIMGYMGFLIRDKDPGLGLGIFSCASIIFLLHLHKVAYRLYYWVEYKPPPAMTREQIIAFFVKMQQQRQQ